MNPTQTTFLATDRIDDLRREASLQHLASSRQSTTRPRDPRSGGRFGRIACLLSALRDRRRLVGRRFARATGAEQPASPQELRTV